jgi:hypothetical protein
MDERKHCNSDFFCSHAILHSVLFILSCMLPIVAYMGSRLPTGWFQWKILFQCHKCLIQLVGKFVR